MEKLGNEFKNKSDMELFLNGIYYYWISYKVKMILTNTINIFGIILSRLIENNRELIVWNQTLQLTQMA